MKPIQFSLIIPTFNRLSELKEMVNSLGQVDKGDYKFELVIVDDGSADSTEDFFRGLRSSFDTRYFKQLNQGPGPARNLGMLKARGDYLLFIDSDCTLPPEYFNELVQAIVKHQPDAFGGPDTYHESFSPLLKAINYSMTSFLGTGGSRGSKKSVTKYYPRSFNMGIAKSVYQKIGGFGDLRHGQDMDYSARIYNAGFKVIYIANAHVYHKRRTSLKKFFNQIHNWGVARINLGSIHPQMWKPIHFLPMTIIVIFCILLLLSFFSSIFRILLVTLCILSMFTAIFAFIQSYLIYRDAKTAGLSIVTLFIQVFAYGLGTLNGTFQKVVLGRHRAQGITKNYYGKN